MKQNKPEQGSGFVLAGVERAERDVFEPLATGQTLDFHAGAQLDVGVGFDALDQVLDIVCVRSSRRTASVTPHLPWLR